jgi:hypothetical protein
MSDSQKGDAKNGDAKSNWTAESGAKPAPLLSGSGPQKKLHEIIPPVGGVNPTDRHRQ